MLEDGRIVEQGTHKELVALRGRYFRMFESQLTVPDTENVSGEWGRSSAPGRGPTLLKPNDAGGGGERAGVGAPADGRGVDAMQIGDPVVSAGRPWPCPQCVRREGLPQRG